MLVLQKFRVEVKKQLIKLLICHLPELIRDRDGHGAQLLIFICQLRFHLAQRSKQFDKLLLNLDPDFL